MYLNEATLLNNIRVRYSKDRIYVSTDRRKRNTLMLLFSPELELITGLRPNRLVSLLECQ